MRIEFILRESTIKDVIKPWVDTGHKDNSNDGGFVFKDADNCTIDNGVVKVFIEGLVYVYNTSDFYRIKVQQDD